MKVCETCGCVIGRGAYRGESVVEAKFNTFLGNYKEIVRKVYYCKAHSPYAGGRSEIAMLRIDIDYLLKVVAQLAGEIRSPKKKSPEKKKRSKK